MRINVKMRINPMQRIFERRGLTRTSLRAQPPNELSQFEGFLRPGPMVGSRIPMGFSVPLVSKAASLALVSKAGDGFRRWEVVAGGDGASAVYGNCITFV